jgi:hypothetical protein
MRPGLCVLDDWLRRPAEVDPETMFNLPRRQQHSHRHRHRHRQRPRGRIARRPGATARPERLGRVSWPASPSRPSEGPGEGPEVVSGPPTTRKIGSPGRIRTSDRVEVNKVRGYCLWQKWALGVLALDEKLRDNPC